MMKYYYLNSEKKPQGPYSKEEMQSFLNSGVINDKTLAAVAGDSKWKALSELFSSEEQEECSTWNTELGNCPHCKLALEGKSVPENCPGCGHGRQGHSKGLWGAFIYAIKNSFNWKGRATRTEFWGFYLFYYIIYQVLNAISNALIPSGANEALQKSVDSDDLGQMVEGIATYFQDATVIVILSLTSIIWLVFLFPFLSVSVRRLHDTGRSAFAVIFGSVAYIAFMGSFIWFIGVMMCNLADTEVMEPSDMPDFTFAMLSLMVNSLILFVMHIYLFIMMLIPSQKGPNKYGPSTVYPRG